MQEEGEAHIVICEISGLAFEKGASSIEKG
jgi:hypothetical protein